VIDKTASNAKTVGNKRKPGTKAVVNTAEKGVKKTGNAIKKIIP